jgi:hypothetical protein
VDFITLARASMNDFVFLSPPSSGHISLEWEDYMVFYLHGEPDIGDEPLSLEFDRNSRASHASHGKGSYANFPIFLFAVCWLDVSKSCSMFTFNTMCDSLTFTSIKQQMNPRDEHQIIPQKCTLRVAEFTRHLAAELNL